MLKISSEESGDRVVTLRLEGRIAEPWTSELCGICEKLLGENRTVKLVLADVSFLDRGSVHLLMKLKSQGVALTDCSPFTAEQLKGA